MIKDLEFKLVSEFPGIFRDYGADPAESCMAWGIDTGDGWFDLICNLCLKLEAIRKVSGLQVTANQVKEKFGTLCFYYSTDYSPDLDKETNRIWSGIIDAVVEEAEFRSTQVCELSGAPGHVMSKNGWLKTISPVQALVEGFQERKDDIDDEFWS